MLKYRFFQVHIFAITLAPLRIICSCRKYIRSLLLPPWKQFEIAGLYIDASMDPNAWRIHPQWFGIYTKIRRSSVRARDLHAVMLRKISVSLLLQEPKKNINPFPFVFLLKVRSAAHAGALAIVTTFLRPYPQIIVGIHNISKIRLDFTFTWLNYRRLNIGNAFKQFITISGCRIVQLHEQNERLLPFEVNLHADSAPSDIKLHVHGTCMAQHACCGWVERRATRVADFIALHQSCTEHILNFSCPVCAVVPRDKCKHVTRISRFLGRTFKSADRSASKGRHSRFPERLIANRILAGCRHSVELDAEELQIRAVT